MQISVSKIRHSVASSIKKNMPNLYDDIFYYAMYRNYRKRKNTDPNEYAMAIKSDYEKVTGKTLDIHSPRTYSEKIQYLKLYDDNPMRTQLTDKVLVRDWIKETIGEKYLIPIIGVYECFNDIDFDLLPNQFVLKTNHGSGWNVIVKDYKECYRDYALHEKEKHSYSRRGICRTFTCCASGPTQPCYNS